MSSDIGCDPLVIRTRPSHGINSPGEVFVFLLGNTLGSQIFVRSFEITGTLERRHNC